jgi:hypothetical protein
MHKPTPSNRALVVALASCGVQQTKIAEHVRCAPKTLRAAYRHELDCGLEAAVAGAAANMFRLATRDSMTGFKAAAHVLDHFGGQAWRDVKRAEVALVGEPSEDGGLTARERIMARLDAIRANMEGRQETIEDSGADRVP